jgi:hypothetical protein
VTTKQAAHAAKMPIASVGSFNGKEQPVRHTAQQNGRFVAFIS